MALEQDGVTLRCAYHSDREAQSSIYVEGCGHIPIHVCSPCAERILHNGIKVGRTWVCKYCFVPMESDASLIPIDEPHKETCPRVEIRPKSEDAEQPA